MAGLPQALKHGHSVTLEEFHVLYFTPHKVFLKKLFEL